MKIPGLSTLKTRKIETDPDLRDSGASAGEDIDDGMARSHTRDNTRAD